MSYTFDTNWIQAFESPWCTSEKFKYANAITGREYENLLDMPNGYYRGGTLLSALAVVERLEVILSQNFNHCHQIWIKEILGPLYCSESFSRYFVSHLRYCPKCIALGYHSMYTQLLWVSHCPFHDIPLKDHVPTDRANDCLIQMHLEGRKKHIGFELKYNEPNIVLSPRNLFKYWQAPLDVSCIPNRPSSDKDYRCSLYYMPFSLLEYESTLDYFTCKVPKIQHILRLDSVHFQRLSSIISPDMLRIPFKGNTDISSIEIYLEALYMASYKAIAKQLRDKEDKILVTVNALHPRNPNQCREPLIKLAKRGALTKDVYVYLLWSRDILGYSSYMWISPTTLDDDSDIEYSLFFDYIMYEVREYYLSNSNMPIENLLVILQCIIPKLFWAHYRNYELSSSNFDEMVEKNAINLNIKKLGVMPLWVSYYDEDSNTCYLLDSEDL